MLKSLFHASPENNNLYDLLGYSLIDGLGKNCSSAVTSFLQFCLRHKSRHRKTDFLKTRTRTRYRAVYLIIRFIKRMKINKLCTLDFSCELVYLMTNRAFSSFKRLFPEAALCRASSGLFFRISSALL